jgi:MFS family permease
MNIRQPPFFYGWVIVGTAVIGMTILYGVRNAFAVFFPPLLDEFGWSRGGTALIFSLNLLIYGLLAPIVGSLADRWKPRIVMTAGIIILSLSTASCALANELWHFYLFFGLLMPIGQACCGWPILGPALVNWFVRRRGRAIGLGQIGAGLSFTFGLFAEFVMSKVGWRHTYFVMAGILVVVLLPMYLFFMYYRPEDKGVKGYGSAETAAASSLAESSKMRNPSNEWTLRSAMRTYQLWLLVISYFLFWGLAGYLIQAHQVKFAVDMGYSSAFAASIYALFGVCVVAGLLSASLSDWLGREKTITLSTILALGAVLALISVKDNSQPWLLYLYATFFGYANGLYWPTMHASAADIFPGRNFGAIAGLLVTGVGVGGIIGPWLGGYIYDISGSYFSAFVLCLICFVLACIAVWIAAPRHAEREVRLQ